MASQKPVKQDDPKLKCRQFQFFMFAHPAGSTDLTALMLWVLESE